MGGDKVLTKQSSGVLFTDDDAFKKAFTDALANALKTLGAGADIYLNVHDSNKYVDDPANQAPPPEAERYLKWAADQIAAFETKDQLLTWWAGEKQARFNHRLTQEHVDTLKAEMLKRFPPEQRQNEHDRQAKRTRIDALRTASQSPACRLKLRRPGNGHG